MALMALSHAIAGIVQRVLGMDYLTTQGCMKRWHAVFWVSAWGLTIGVVKFLIDFFRLGEAKA
jgi:hypothetical protein